MATIQISEQTRRKPLWMVTLSKPYLIVYCKRAALLRFFSLTPELFRPVRLLANWFA